MSRTAGSIVRGNSKPRRIYAKRAGSRWGVYCQSGQRSRYGVPRGRNRPFRGLVRGLGRQGEKPLVNRGYHRPSNPHKTAISFLKAHCQPVSSIDGQRCDHGSARPRSGQTLGRGGLDCSRRGERTWRHLHGRCMPAGNRRRSAGRGSRRIGHGGAQRILRLVSGPGLGGAQINHRERA